MNAEREKEMTKATNDRLSTWEEVRQATTVNPEGMLELCRRMGLPCRVRNEPSELEEMNTSELELLLHLQSSENMQKN